MHDQPLNQPFDPSSQRTLSPEEVEHLEQRLTSALETVPMPHIPADFAARVAGQLPAKRPESLTPTRYGQSAMRIGVVLTLVALLALAVRASGKPDFGLAESFLLTLFVGLVLWLSIWRHSLR
jgi:ABC-type transport system involved in cytochrome c biogenesis permease subunit